MIPVRVSAVCIGLLLLLRAVMAALLPLSGDEAYYWLWSKHLALGYYDHPPMIAWLIRAGTALLGDTALGVRLMGVVLSLPATWLVWRGAALILKDEDKAALAALFFNITLMVSVEMLAATPDMPSLAAAAALVYCLARLQATQDGRWWLMVGLAAGLGLLSKYSALFLGLGMLVWLLADRDARRWLRSPWPYLGGGVALLVFAPHLLWQAQHGWMTFVFQFGRVSTGHFTLRYLGEFAAGQLALATPLIFVLMAIGLWRAWRPDGGLRMLAALVWTGLAYFLIHALHDRVQGNWPCFLYPALAILAAGAVSARGAGRWLSLAAAPLAALLLLLAYAQAQFGLVPLKKDPAARILGRNFRPIGDVAAALTKAGMADAILTTDYETTAWLRFYYPGVKVVQVNEPQRYLDAPAPPPALLRGRLVYLAEMKRDQNLMLRKSFGRVGFPTQLQTPASLYMAYPVSRPKTPTLGKMP